MQGQLILYKGKRGDVWRLRFWDASGKRVTESLPAGTSKSDAKRILAERTVDVTREGHRRADTKTTFKTYAETWLPAYVEAESLRKSTAAGYGVIVRILVREFGSVKVSAVTPAKIREAMGRWTSTGSSGRTVNSRIAVLKIIMRDAVADSLISTNPVAAVRAAKQKRTVERPLSPSEIGRVVVSFDQIIADNRRDKDDAIVSKAIFLFACETGCRKGEIIGLKWKHVKLADPAGPHVEIIESRVVGETGPPKSPAGMRKIALDPSIAEALFEHRSWTKYQGDDELVFPNPRKGSTFDAMVYSSLFKTALGMADVEDAEGFRPFHGLRRTSLTNAAAAGVHSSALQTRAGHSSYSMTQEYVALADQTFADETAKAGARMWGTVTS